MMLGLGNCSRCGGGDPNCYVCNNHKEMKPRYFKKGGLIWKFDAESDETAFVRIVCSTDGWVSSAMTISDMTANTEISQEEGEQHGR